MRVPLYRLAHARSGDKGDGSNVGLLAYDRQCYELIRAQVTPARVKAHFRGIVRGKVERFDIPNLLGLNFLLHDSLGGGGSSSLKLDAQGKSHGMALLLLEIDVPPRFPLPRVGSAGALAPGGVLADPRAGRHLRSGGRPARATPRKGR
ncbi:MAG: hypothetical protein ACE5HD_12135 [Acidobacteriota bacterium]